MKSQEITPRPPRYWIVIDVESAVLDDTAHKRYQQMERWVPDENKPIRRGYQRSDDPLTCPRWVFQSITTASMMVLREDEQGGIDVNRFVTLSAPDHDERDVLAGICGAPLSGAKCVQQRPANGWFHSINRRMIAG